MFKPGYFLSALFVLLLINSCTHSQEKEIITERIKYDVEIKNPDQRADWWDRNIPGPSRENLINRVMDAAYSGKLNVYSNTGKLLTPDEVKNIGCEEIQVTFQRPDPPYESYDTIVVQKLNFRDITRLRFLEEWHFDKNEILIRKKTLGIAPVMESYDPEGKLRGYHPLFWIYFDDKYPLKLN